MPTITFNPGFFERLLYEDPFTITLILIKNGGWVVLVFVMLWGLKEIWLRWRAMRYDATRKFVLLAIDIPKGNEQTPKAVENIFSQLAGAHGSITWWEKWWRGEFQEYFSIEIISVDGYVQFIVWCHEMLRDLVEASIYAQYPDAEISEIEDYAQKMPAMWPNDKYEFFGLEYKLFRHEVYPIRTYQAFEDPSTKATFKDPMAALLEIMGNLRKGEQVWYQLVIEPVDDKWANAATKIIDKLIGRKTDEKKSLLDKIFGGPLDFVVHIIDQILWAGGDTTTEKKVEDPPTMMLHLTPGEKGALEAIERKTSKIAFRTKFRIMYIAEKEVYHKARGVGAVIGASKQFNTVDLNRFDVIKRVWTKENYAFKNIRIANKQRKIMHAYKVRSNWRGGGPGFILNIEELATMWHFPVMEVKAPLLKKTESKKAEPPFTLPMAREGSTATVPPLAPPPDEELVEVLGEIPEDITAPEDQLQPTPPDLEEKLSLTNKYIEKKLAKKKDEPQTPKPTPPSNLPFVD